MILAFMVIAVTCPEADMASLKAAAFVTVTCRLAVAHHRALTLATNQQFMTSCFTF